MQNAPKIGKWGTLATILIPVWFIMNIRVELGAATTFERALDGLVGMAVLVTAAMLAAAFYQNRK